MAIMKAIEKCQECYKDENNCLLTLNMRGRCKGPYHSKQEQIAALRSALSTHRATIKEVLRERRQERHG